MLTKIQFALNSASESRAKTVISVFERLTFSIMFSVEIFKSTLFPMQIPEQKRSLPCTFFIAVRTDYAAKFVPSFLGVNIQNVKHTVFLQV